MKKRNESSIPLSERQYGRIDEICAAYAISRATCRRLAVEANALHPIGRRLVLIDLDRFRALIDASGNTETA